MATYVIEQTGKATIRALHAQQRRELRLPARPAVVNQELLCRLPCNRLAEVILD
jgi:hypothetical protein